MNNLKLKQLKKQQTKLYNKKDKNNNIFNKQDKKIKDKINKIYEQEYKIKKGDKVKVVKVLVSIQNKESDLKLLGNIYTVDKINKDTIDIIIHKTTYPQTKWSSLYIEEVKPENVKKIINKKLNQLNNKTYA